MSQASKKVDWCINKAQRELQEIGFHRRHVKGDSDILLA